MEFKIEGYEPKMLFHFFEEISSIPRGSGNEKGISDYLVDFAIKRNLEYYQDKDFNVIIKKQASVGAENKPAVMLQGHVDMVCEKRADVEHDFMKDGLKLYVKDGMLMAEGTTLGADNGIAVALMLTVLDDKSLKNPPLECVFTTGEEIGLLGAVALDKTKISARTMINLDSEEEGVATVSCAGGLRYTGSKEISGEIKKGVILKIEVSGLLGGHSGMDIDKERNNANILMARIIYKIMKSSDCNIVSFEGGTKDNAIPRECKSQVMFSSLEEAKKGENALNSIIELLKSEICPYEADFKVETSLTEEKECFAVSKEDSTSFINAIRLAPNGIRSRNINMNGFVVTSLNLGIAQLKDNKAKLIFAPRSSVASLQEDTKEVLGILFDTFGFEKSIDGEYPGWSYAEKSPVRDVFCNVYKNLFDKDLRIEAIHAGLECGLFSDAIDNLDAIAVGPDIYGCHTPDERLPLDSVERFYKLLSSVLEYMSEN